MQTGGDDAAAQNGAPPGGASVGGKSLSQKLGGSLSFLKRTKSTGSSRAEKLRKDIDFTEHTWPEDKLYAYYGATPEGGLTGAQVLQNRQKFGSNMLTPPATTPW